MDFLVYVICLTVGLVFALYAAIAGHIFGHADSHVDGSGGHAEAGADGSDMPGVSAFSPTVIATFISAFGGFGIIFHEIPATRTTWISAPLAMVGAFIVAAVVLSVLNFIFSKTQGSSESKTAKLMGMTATVITPIPANGVGEIAYEQGGTRYTAPARTESGVEVGSGRMVKIARIVGSQFFVTPE